MTDYITPEMRTAVRYWHGNSCYPKASDGEIDILLSQLAPLLVRVGMDRAADLFEMVSPASDEERHNGDPGAGAMGAVLEFRDLIRRTAAEEV